MITSLLLITLMGGCSSHVVTIPGPLGPVGKTYMTPSAHKKEGPPKSVDSKGLRRPHQWRGKVVKASTFYLSHPTAGFRNDCSGYVGAVFSRVGLPLSGTVQSLWDQARYVRAVHYRRLPSTGDLVFFDNTHDRNSNRRLDDVLTHIGVVLEVEPDGTILIAHDGTSKGRSTMRMNLIHRQIHRDGNGNVLNDYLRSRTSADRPRTRYLAGELFRGFATVRHTQQLQWLSPIK